MRSRSRSSSGSRPSSMTHSWIESRQRMRQRSRSPTLRATVSPAISHRRRRSPSPSIKYKSRHRTRGLPSRSDAEKRSYGSHGDEGGGRCSTRHKHESQFSIWEKFRGEADKLEVEMAETRLRYERSPEKHPRYAAEWKTFYSKKVEEMKGKKTLDPRSEGLKLEWIGFWGEKMNELLAQEFRNRKDALRERLGLPEEEKPPIRLEAKRKFEKRYIHSECEDDWIPPPPRKLSERPIITSIPQLHVPNPGRKPVTISDVQTTWRVLTGGIIESQKSSTRANDFDNKWAHSESGIIATLRLISALEEQLGSLGPQINTLLSQALSVQRSGGSLTPLAHSPGVAVLLETVREKLLGQLQTGIVKTSIMTAVHRAIYAISNILEIVHFKPVPSQGGDVGCISSITSHNITSIRSVQPQLKEAIETVTRHLVPESTQNLPSISGPEPAGGAPLSVPGIGNVNKVAIAQEIALVLIDRGRTDVSEGELKNLVDQVIGLTQAQNAVDCEPKEAHELPLEERDLYLVDNQVSSNLSSRELMTGSYDQTSTNKFPPQQLSIEHNKPKYTLIEVDLEKEPCKKSYRDFSVHAYLSSLEQKRNQGEVHSNNLKRLVQRFFYLNRDEQQCVISYLHHHRSEHTEEVEMLRDTLARERLMGDEQAVLDSGKS